MQHFNSIIFQDLKQLSYSYCLIVQQNELTPRVHISRFPRWLCGKEPTCQAGDLGFSNWTRKTPWRRKWQHTPAFLPGKSHDRGTWPATVHGVTKSWHDLATKQQRYINPLFWISFSFSHHRAVEFSVLYVVVVR